MFFDETQAMVVVICFAYDNNCSFVIAAT